MSRNKFRICLVFGLLSVFASSCAYPISQRYRRQAKPGLTFAMVYRNPGAYKGDVVIWGGMIIKTVNSGKGSEIYILETPLHYGERPEPMEYSEGRFIAGTRSYMDPLVYRRGKMVTVAGEVVGFKQIINQDDKLAYSYPVIQIRELTLWRKRRYYNPYYPYGWYGPYWGYGFYPY
ncbi:MAG: Slp family lipoprotein [Nitrospirota bacterium]